MDQYFVALHTCHRPRFVLKLHILCILFLLETSASFRQGENGRYLYKDDLGLERYCRYCPPGIMNENEIILKYQEPRCFHNNFPFQEKCDDEEQEKKLRPICKFGTLPSCPLLKMPNYGHWNCTSSSFYNKTVDGYFIPVYTICQLMCDPGLRPTEGDITYCRETRAWDRDPDTITCHRSKPSNGARMIDSCIGSGPIYVGLPLLDLSELFMNEFYYDSMTPRHHENAVHFTDSLVMLINTNDAFADTEKTHYLYPKDHPLFSDDFNIVWESR